MTQALYAHMNNKTIKKKKKGGLLALKPGRGPGVLLKTSLLFGNLAT
jgi:hypothetical protein